MGRPARKSSSFRLGIAVAAALLLLVPLVQAEEVEVNRDEYVQRVDAICKKSKATNERILHGVKKLVVKRKAYALAGKRVLRAARSFARSVQQIASVPQPAADHATLQRWIGYLRTEKSLLLRIGKALKEGKTRLVSRLESKVSHVNRQANNTVFSFEFAYCDKEVRAS